MNLIFFLILLLTLHLQQITWALPATAPASGCDAISDKGRCYSFFTNTGKNWQTSRDECLAWGGDLATVTSLEEYTLMYSLNTAFQNCWIGLNDIDIEGTFVWADGNNSTYRLWGPGEPNDALTGQDCGCTWVHRIMDDCNCEWTSSIPCYFCSKIVYAKYGFPYGGCDAISTSGKCINYLQSTGIPWVQALNECPSDQLLASISSSKENDVLYSLTAGETYTDCWIGLHDRNVEDSFQWFDNSEVTYVNWRYGQPNEGSGDEDCVQITPDSYWYDVSCDDDKQCYFCTSEVSQFGRETPEEGLGDDTILTEDTKLYCVAEDGGTVTWNYIELGGYSSIISTTTTDSHGVSELEIKLEEPGYYSCEVTQDNGIPRMYTVAMSKSGIYTVDPFGQDVFTLYYEVLGHNAVLTTSQTIYCVASTADVQSFEWVYINADGIATTIPHVTGTSKGVSALNVSITNPGSYSCEVTPKIGTKSIFSVILVPTLYTDPIIGCDAITDEGNCFRYTHNDDGIDWYNAQSSCEANGGDLASISSSRENNLLLSLFTNGVSSCWIGLDEESTYQAKWIDGTPIEYRNFGGGRRRRSPELNKQARFRRQGGSQCFVLSDDSFWYGLDCLSPFSCYLCTNKVSQFGQLSDVNRYTALDDNAILTATTTLHCITEPLGTPHIIWSYVGLDGTMENFDVAADATTGASLLNVDINNPGYYSCEVTLFQGEDRKKYTTALLDPSITTLISAADTLYYTHGVDRDGILLFCHSFDKSLAFGDIVWRTASSIEFPNPLEVSNLPLDSYTIDCVDTSSGTTLFTVNLVIQGPPVGTINGLNIDTFSLPPPLLNRAFVQYNAYVILDVNVMYPNMGWKGPSTETTNSRAGIEFNEPDIGEYYFNVINWDKEQQLALQILIEVHPIGLKQGNDYIPLEENSIIPNSGNAYCIGGAGSTNSWWLSGYITSGHTGINILPLEQYGPGNLICYANISNISTSFRVIFLQNPAHTVVEESGSYIFTEGQGSDEEFLFCHKADKSVYFVLWREVGRTQTFANPLSTSDLQTEGRYLMECFDPDTNETILTIDLLLQGPVVITLDTGYFVSTISTTASLNYRAPNVVMSVNAVGKWRRPDTSYVEASSIRFSTFELSDEGEYAFLVSDWIGEYQEVTTIYLNVNPFGLQISANVYEESADYSVIPASTTLYCIDSIDYEVEWLYEDLAGTITNLEPETEQETGVSLLSVSIEEPGFYRCRVDSTGTGYTHTTVLLNTSIYTVVQQTGQYFRYTIGVDTESTPLICIGGENLAFMDSDLELSNPFEVGSIPNNGMNRTIQCRDTEFDMLVSSFILFMQGPPVTTLDAGTSNNYELLFPEVNSAFVNLKSPNVGLHVNIPGRWQRPDDTFVEDISIIFPTFDTPYEGLYKFYVFNWDNEETLAMQIMLTVYPFGEKIDENTYRALEDNSYLTASTTLYCISGRIWFYTDIRGSYQQSSISSGTEVSEFSIDIDNPGIYGCETYSEIYEILLLDESIHTFIQASDLYTYTHGVDREDTSLFCYKSDNSISFADYTWLDIESSYFGYSYNLVIAELEKERNHTLICEIATSNEIILVADILIQGPPEITLDTGEVERYASLTPGENTASINLLTENVVLATVLAGRWQRPNGTFVQDKSITFSAFEISDQGVYTFYVINWEKIETLAIEILLTVYPFGEKKESSEYNYLQDGSVLTVSTTLYCITDLIDIPVVFWNYEDLEGVNTSLSAETDFFTGFSSLSVTTDRSGYYSCDVIENGISKIYTIAVTDPYLYQVVEDTESYLYTVGIDKDIAFLFCHKYDNSVPFQFIGWKEEGTTVRTLNPLDIADIPNDGAYHTMECLDTLDDTQIFTVDILIQGPPVITLDTGNVASFSQLFPYINTAYVNHKQRVVLEANMIGQWKLPSGSYQTGTLELSSFQINEEGLYIFYIINWEFAQTAIIQIMITANPFGEKIDSTTYRGLQANSILNTNTDLFCLNGEVTWSYTDLAGISTDRTGTVEATGASVLSAYIDTPGYYSCEVTLDGSINRYTVAVLDTTLLQVIETYEAFQYTIGVDNEDIFLFCHKSDNSIPSANIGWRKNDTIPDFKNPLDVFEVGNLFKYTDTYLMECLDRTSRESILNAEISMQGPPVITMNTGILETFNSLTTDGNTAFIIIQTQNVVMSVNLVGKWQRPDDTHEPVNTITFLSFDESDVGVYKFYVTDWYNQQKLAIQIQLSLSESYPQGVTDLSAVTSGESSILVTWGLLAEKTTLSDEKFSIFYGYENVEYFAGTTTSLYFNIIGLTLYFNYTIRVDLRFAYSTETYSESVYHYLMLPEITEAPTLKSISHDFYAQEGVLIAVIVFLLLIIAAILAVAIIVVFCVKRHLAKKSG